MKVKLDLMCTITLTYDENNALARKELATLLNSGLFFVESEENKPDEVQITKEERDAFLAASKKSMSHIISRHV